MRIPYFTLPDPDLVRAGGGRDPLSLLPVWSPFGRVLVPNLASPVSQVTGVIAVLFIHWLSEKPLEKFLSEGDKNFRQYFRLMEGLLEYYFWNSSDPNGGLCFGTQALSADRDDFKVTAKDARTAVNGLYQYYRGTCRRARLLEADWVVSEAVGDALSACWGEKATAALETVLSVPLGNSSAAIVPSAAFKQQPELKKGVEAVYNSLQLRELLQLQLLGDACHIALAAKCAMLNEQKTDYSKEGMSNWYLRQLSDWMQSDGCAAKELLTAVARAQKCEPFLLVLQDCFDFMLASPGEKITDLPARLQENANQIRQRAGDFLKLASSNHSERMMQMFSLAEMAQSDIPLFLGSLLEHHRKCMKERGRDPMAFLDGEKIIAPVSSGRDSNSILERLETGLPWVNGYYLWNAGEIYRKLFGGQNG